MEGLSKEEIQWKEDRFLIKMLKKSFCEASLLTVGDPATTDITDDEIGQASRYSSAMLINQGKHYSHEAA